MPVHRADCPWRTQMVDIATRNGASMDRYMWSQDREMVMMHVYAPNGTRGHDIYVKLKEKYLRISMHEPQVPFSPNLFLLLIMAGDKLGASK